MTEVKLKIRPVKKARGALLNSPEKVFKKCKHIANSDREIFICFYLNPKNYVIDKEIIAVGTLNYCTIHPREVYKNAIIKSACSIIVAHNHSSGNCEPSEADLEITQRLLQAGKIIGIELLDHVIVGRDNYFSFKDKKLIV